MKNHFNESNRFAVEEIAFADGTLWDAEAIKSRSLLGDTRNDDLRGFDGRDDLIEGGTGNDTLAGGVGDDWLEGGPGSDTYRSAWVTARTCSTRTTPLARTRWS